MIEAIVVVVAIVVAIAILIPVLTSMRRSARQTRNGDQLRGFHNGFVSYASMQFNKSRGRNAYFPGLQATGQPTANGPDTGHSGDGSEPGARLWMMLDGNVFPPDYMTNPADAHAVEMAYPFSGTVPPVTHENFSYAFQSLAGHPDERAEWSETLNGQAIILGDRAIGTGPADISSVWTEPGSGDWRGGVVRNDNSTSFETRPVITDTQYGMQPANLADDLFEDDPATADAFLVHDDATTAYSKD